MDIRPIHTKKDYKAALREVSAYFDDEPAPGTPDGDRFEIPLTLVEAHESGISRSTCRMPSRPSSSAWSRPTSLPRIWCRPSAA